MERASGYQLVAGDYSIRRRHLRASGRPRSRRRAAGTVEAAGEPATWWALTPKGSEVRESPPGGLPVPRRTHDRCTARLYCRDPGSQVAIGTAPPGPPSVPGTGRVGPGATSGGAAADVRARHVAPASGSRSAGARARPPPAAARGRGARPARRRRRPQTGGRPTRTARAPSARALTTSVPRRMPPSTQHLEPAVDRLDDLGRSVDRRGDPVELPAAVVGDDDRRRRRARRRAAASSAVRIPLSTIGSPPAAASRSTSGQVTDAERTWRRRSGVARPGRASPVRQLGRNREPGPVVALAPAEHRGVHRQHERRRIRARAPAASSSAASACRSGRRAGTSAAHRSRRSPPRPRSRSVDTHMIVPAARGGPGHRRLAVGMGEALERHRRDEHRQRDLVPEHRRRRRRLRHVDQHPRPQPPARDTPRRCRAASPRRSRRRREAERRRIEALGGKLLVLPDVERDHGSSIVLGPVRLRSPRPRLVSHPPAAARRTEAPRAGSPGSAHRRRRT